jgi:two-component system cell cycle response regulator
MVKVLIVDDDEPILFLLSAIVSSMPDITVVQAHDGTEAIEMAKVEKPDIMLLDNRMPGMNGFEVCRSIKSDPLLEHTRILMLSCQGHNFDWELAQQLGAEAYLTKPFETEVLIAKVKEMTKR